MTVILTFIILIPVISLILYLGTNTNNKCAELTRSIENNLIIFNQNLANYEYHVDTLKADYDLTGDLAVWYNHLANQRRYLIYELSNLKECPNTAHFTYDNISEAVKLQ